MTHLRSKIALLLAVVIALTTVPALASTAGATGRPAPTTSQVWVTHGLPLDDSGTVVDVYVDGALTIEDFTFGQTVGPLTLPVATYGIQVKLANTDTVAIDQAVTVPAGGNFSVVASYTDADGALGLNVFSNDLSKIRRHTARVALHHAAAAPAVDVDAALTRYPLFRATPVTGAVNGQQAVVTVPSWLRYDFDVRVAGTDTTVLSLDAVKFQGRRLTNVYVVGSAAGGTLQAVTSVIKP